MNYKRLTVEAFKERLENNEYNGITGARRAVGKTDWSEKDRNRARVFIDEHFAKSAKPTLPAGHKGVKKAYRAKKNTAAAAEKPKAPKKVAAKASAAKAAPAKKAAAAAKTPPRIPVIPTPLPNVNLSRQPPSPSVPNVLEDTSRQTAAAMVIQTFHGSSGQLSQLERDTYEIACVEYQLSARNIARNAVDVARRGIPTPSALPTATKSEPAVVTAGGPARVPVNGSPELSPQEQQQMKSLEAAAADAGVFTPGQS